MSEEYTEKICLFGAGGHGRVIAKQMLRSGLTGLCYGDENLELHTLVVGVPVLFTKLTAVTDCKILITIGNNEFRCRLQKEAAQLGLKTMVFIAEPQSYFSTHSPGEGSMILHGAIINDNARIGSSVIINSAAVIEHDAKVGDFSHISPGAVLAGGCEVGDHCWIGANATVIQEARITSGVTIGAGSVVLHDIDEPGVYVGSPIRKIK